MLRFETGRVLSIKKQGSSQNLFTGGAKRKQGGGPSQL